MDRLAVISGEAERLASVVAGADPEARVPTCPDWNVVDLLWHLTEVHTFWAAILGGGLTSDEDVAALEESPPVRPDDLDEMLSMRAAATADLVALLGRLDDAERRWTWWPGDQTVGFTRRMQTYEATMHRVDAELAAGGDVTPIDAEVAAGAVDHAVDVMWGWMPDWAVYTPAAVVALEATDTGQRWAVEVGRWGGTGPESGKQFDEARALRADVGAATATASGPVATLATWVWGRGGMVEIAGDGTAQAALRAVVDQGMQ